MSCQNPHNQKVAAVFGFAIRLASHPFLHPRLLRLVWVWWRSAILILTPPVPSKGKWCFEKIESEKSLCFRHLDFSLWFMTYKLSFLLLFRCFVHYAADSNTIWEIIVASAEFSEHVFFGERAEH